MHNFVYLAQRRSQEFSCEPNFGGGGRAHAPLGCASEQGDVSTLKFGLEKPITLSPPK